MATIYGVDISAYIVSIYDNINDQYLSCNFVGVGRCHHWHHTDPATGQVHCRCEGILEDFLSISVPTT